MLALFLTLWSIFFSQASPTSSSPAPSQWTNYDDGFNIDSDSPNSSVCRHRLGQEANNSQMMCIIVRLLEGCQFDSGFFQYLKFSYCDFSNQIVPTIFIIAWLIVLLIGFANIADSFFSPALIALARTFRMSENLAWLVLKGVTLLAFGNGAPDVFSALTAITTGDPDAPDEGLGLGFLLGSGFLVNTVTVGLILLISPFTMCRRPFLKDVLFYLLAIAWSASILIKGYFTRTDAIGFLVVYLIYVLITWSSGALYKSRSRRLPPRMDRLLSRFQPPFKAVKSCMTGCWSKMDRSRGFQKAKVTETDQSNHVGQVDSQYPDSLGPVIDVIKDPKPVPGIKLEIPTDESIKAKGEPSRSGVAYPVIEITPSDNPADQDPEGSIDHQQPNRLGLTNRLSLTHRQWEGPTCRFAHAKPSSRFRASSMSTPYQRSSAEPSILSSYSHNPTLTTSGVGGGRSHSVCRRRASTRLMSVTHDLPFMVRWIIATRGQEEKDLGGTEGESRRTKRTSTPGVDGSESVAIDGFSSCPSSRLPSHLASTCHTPSRTFSPVNSIEHDHVLTDIVSSGDLRHSTPERTQNLSEIDLYDHHKEHDDDIYTSDSFELTEWERWASQGPWHHLAYHLAPVNLESWPDQSWFKRLIQLFQIPVVLIFKLTIPVVIEDFYETTGDDGDDLGDGSPNSTTEYAVSDEYTNNNIDKSDSVTASCPTDIESGTSSSSSMDRDTAQCPSFDWTAMHGWCKFLNVAHCVIVPTLWPLLITANRGVIGLMPIASSRIPIFLPFFLIGLVVALLVALTSKWNEPPHWYHRPLFACLGFATSIIWIYAMAHELVNALETLGIVWHISEAILGISAMAWASSIGDIMANCLLAKNGYPKIAFSACIGSPLFNLLLGAGLSYFVKISRSDKGYAELTFTFTQAILFSLLMFVLICHVVNAMVRKFRFGRIYGAFLLALYTILLTIAILIEVDVILPPESWQLDTGIE